MKHTHTNSVSTILDLANNHNGDVEKGLEIIEAISPDYIKLQLRHPSIIRKGFEDQCKRFVDTFLSEEDFTKLVYAIDDKENSKLIITPFDEISVKDAAHWNPAFLKVASCSCKDWPLLEAIASIELPVICSTGGCDISDVDRIVSFFEHKGIDLTLMHCISLYPCEDSSLSFMETMMKRYPHLDVGYSGHEYDFNSCVSHFAIAMGAKFVERHVGGEVRNDYSMCANDANIWHWACKKTYDMCHKPMINRSKEREALLPFTRGVWGDGELAIPLHWGQVQAGGKMKPFDTVIPDYVHRIKGLLYEAHVPFKGANIVMLSHHYGMNVFDRYGCCILDFINRSYCKKLLVMLAGQTHPEHYHKEKEETFHILYGDLRMTIDRESKDYTAGDIVLVRTHDRHSFCTVNGCVFEEISSTHYDDDSYYTCVVNETRKTKVKL